MKKAVIFSLFVMFVTSSFAGSNFEVIEKHLAAGAINTIEVGADNADINFVGSDIGVIKIGLLILRINKILLAF